MSRFSKFSNASPTNGGQSRVSRNSQPSLSPREPSLSPREKQLSKLSKERSSITHNSLNKNSQSSVLVSSPRQHDRRSSKKLKNLKEKKVRLAEADDNENKEYDDELDDQVDANDIQVTSRKDT